MPADRARELEQRFGGRFDTEYDTGPRWRLDWVDGPGEPTVRALADAADLAGADLRLHRRRSTKALAVTAIRMKTAGRLDRHDGGRYPQEIVEWEARDLDDPDRGVDALQDTMAELLIAAAKEAAHSARAEWEAARPQRWTAGGSLVPLDATETAVDLVRTRGVGWLVGQAITNGATAAPLIVLSARYAITTGADHAVAWRDRGQPMPLHAAGAAGAIADPELTEPAAVALLAVLPDLRAECARTEADITTAARRAGLPGAQIEASLTSGANR